MTFIVTKDTYYTKFKINQLTLMSDMMLAGYMLRMSVAEDTETINGKIFITYDVPVDRAKEVACYLLDY